MLAKALSRQRTEVTGPRSLTGTELAQITGFLAEQVALRSLEAAIHEQLKGLNMRSAALQSALEGGPLTLAILRDDAVVPEVRSYVADQVRMRLESPEEAGYAHRAYKHTRGELTQPEKREALRQIAQRTVDGLNLPIQIQSIELTFWGTQTANLRWGDRTEDVGLNVTAQVARRLAALPAGQSS